MRSFRLRSAVELYLFFGRTGFSQVSHRLSDAPNLATVEAGRLNVSVAASTVNDELDVLVFAFELGGHVSDSCAPLVHPTPVLLESMRLIARPPHR